MPKPIDVNGIPSELVWSEGPVGVMVTLSEPPSVREPATLAETTVPGPVGTIGVLNRNPKMLGAPKSVTASP